MSELLASKVVIQEEEPQIRSVPALPTAVLGIVGTTERGPVGVASFCTSFAEFYRKFGGDYANADIIHQVRGFFQGGGQFLWATRTVHYGDPATPGSKTSVQAEKTIQTAASGPTSGFVLGSVAGPWDLDASLSAWDLKLLVDVVGPPPAPTAAAFTATAASRESATEKYVLADGQVLTVKIDQELVEQTITFLTGEFADIGDATAQEVANVINAKLFRGSAILTGGGTKVTIVSDRKGGTSGVDVTGGDANVALGFTTGNVAGTGNVDDISAVQFSEVKTIVEAIGGIVVTEDVGRVRITTSTPGPTGNIQVHATSISYAKFGLDTAVHAGTSGAAVNTLKVQGKTDGAYANAYSIRISAATSGVASEFNLSVEDGGVVLEVWPNLTMDDDAANFVETLVNDADNGSNLISATDLDGVAPDYARPANGLHGPLTGGNDGLVGIADADYVGSSVGKTGIRAFDLVSNMTMLAIPGRATAAVQQAMYQYSEVVRERSVFCVFDPPAGSSKTAIVTYFETTAALLGTVEPGATYWPRIKVMNPTTDVYGSDQTLTVAPSGHIAGMFARTDGKRVGGVYNPPAGVEDGQLIGAVGLETTDVLDEATRDYVFPKRINPITLLPGGGGYFVDGARCCKGNGNFPTVAERRGASYIEQSIKGGMQFARHKNNDRKLRKTCERTAIVFLLEQMRAGAFRSTDPKKAFFVDFGDGLNPPSAQFAGKLYGRIGLATQKPAEFIILSFAQDTRAIEEELLAAAQ